MRHRAIRVTFGLAIFALSGAANAAVPDDGAQPSNKPTLYHASPMINDPLIHGRAPITISIPKPDIQAKLPDTSKPPLYRASPMINDPATTIQGKAPQ